MRSRLLPAASGETVNGDGCCCLAPTHFPLSGIFYTFKKVFQEGVLMHHAPKVTGTYWLRMEGNVVVQQTKTIVTISVKLWP